MIGPRLDSETQNYRARFCTQRHHAGNRGIEWHLTFEEWYAWWGQDITNRGMGYGKLCMCRYGDVGPYSLDNIYKDTFENNSIYANPDAHKVMVGSTVYHSINACARATEVSAQTVKARCRSKTGRFSHWQFTQ